MKRIFIRRLISIVMLILLVVSSIIIYNNKAAFLFAFKRCTYSDQELINDCFNMDIPQNASVESVKVKLDHGFDFWVEAKLTVPYDEVSRLFESAGLKFNDASFFPPRLCSRWEISNENLLMGISGMDGAYRTQFGGMESVTTRNKWIAVKKFDNDEVTVFMWIDKQGWD